MQGDTVRMHTSIMKGTGYSEKFGKVTKDLCGTGTSRCSNGLKSGPQLPCQLRLMKIAFLSHKISHLWLKKAFFLAMFGLFLQTFCSSDYIYAYFKLEMHQ